jgi:hypothetical protein
MPLPTPVPREPSSLTCWVELFGTARFAAGIRDLVLPLSTPSTVCELVLRLAKECPALGDAVLDLERGTVAEGYLLNRNGRDFLQGPGAIVQPGDHILVLSSAVGG